MDVTTITVKRIMQVRPYESASLEMTATLTEADPAAVVRGDDPTAAALDLARIVEEALVTHVKAVQRQDAHPDCKQS